RDESRRLGYCAARSRCLQPRSAGSRRQTNPGHAWSPSGTKCNCPIKTASASLLRQTMAWLPYPARHDANRRPVRGIKKQPTGKSEQEVAEGDDYLRRGGVQAAPAYMSTYRADGHPSVGRHSVIGTPPGGTSGSPPNSALTWVWLRGFSAVGTREL